MADLSAFPITARWPAQNPDIIQLYSFPTPNGVKVSIALEELGLPYEPHAVDITKNESWTPEFLSLNPNGKIPAIVDPDGPDGKPLGLFESGAILVYLADKTGKLVPADAAGRYETMQWVFFQMAVIGPMFGQVGFFHKFAGKDIEDKRPLNRYRDESKRLLGVMETRLAGRQWIMGDLYTIADISMLGWVRNLVGFYGARRPRRIRQLPECRRMAGARAGAPGRAARPEHPGAGLRAFSRRDRAGTGARPGSGFNQCSRRQTHNSYCGVRSVGASSSVPILISTSSSPIENSREPQFGQKLRPSQIRVSPEKPNAARGQTAKTIITLPVSWRHSVQWQMPTRVGSPATA